MFGIATLAQAQEHYDTLAAKTFEPRQAYDYSLDLAEAEGALDTFTIVESVRQGLTAKGWSQERILYGVMNAIARELEKGADDTWSGRGNEQKRAKFDGKREAARNIRYIVEAEMNEILQAEKA